MDLGVAEHEETTDKEQESPSPSKYSEEQVEEQSVSVEE